MAYIKEKQIVIKNEYLIGQNQLKTSKSLFKQFHRFPENKIIRTHHNRLIPKVLVKLGKLKGIIYSSDKMQRGHPRTYSHFMKTPPILTSDPTGSQLYIIGGRYRITPNGIEG